MKEIMFSVGLAVYVTIVVGIPYVTFSLFMPMLITSENYAAKVFLLLLVTLLFMLNVTMAVLGYVHGEMRTYVKNFAPVNISIIVAGALLTASYYGLNYIVSSFSA